MKYEKSCGAVVYRKDGGETKFLLLKHKNGQHWGFPKGHVEDGESEMETALREIDEETQIAVDLVNGFKLAIQYSPEMGVIKDVIYFLAKAMSKVAIIQVEEIEEYKWVIYEEGLRLITHENSRKVLAEANDFVSKI